MLDAYYINGYTKQNYKEAQSRINKMKHGLLTQDEVYEWLLNNK